jgi:hypothetical protein
MLCRRHDQHTADFFHEYKSMKISLWKTLHGCKPKIKYASLFKTRNTFTIYNAIIKGLDKTKWIVFSNEGDPGRIELLQNLQQ